MVKGNMGWKRACAKKECIGTRLHGGKERVPEQMICFETRKKRSFKFRKTKDSTPDGEGPMAKFGQMGKTFKAHW